MTLNIEMPMNKPNKPPQLATKSAKVVLSVRFIEMKWCSLNDTNIELDICWLWMAELNKWLDLWNHFCHIKKYSFRTSIHSMHSSAQCLWPNNIFELEKFPLGIWNEWFFRNFLAQIFFTWWGRCWYYVIDVQSGRQSHFFTSNFFENSSAALT